ncbi:glycosyltransferase family 8 protein [Fistulina hepatica ATCC 64428]|uniref:Glycosyltransferase family 8 protein n=1 Tax=Fistulina hepatica ATCC 64428 TaxID=1128425 RepID=A0A0D7APY8_9AGAR|nr:glycosyltransferase family 8 protein [Fistulina hepatica ATCC 64428]
MPYRFTETQDWFSGNESRWRSLFRYVASETPRVLEIGTWEGRSSVFLLTELCKGKGELVTIDHYDLLGTPAGRARREKVLHNLAAVGGKYRIIEDFSVPGMMRVLQDEMLEDAPGFDWLYVDGSHRADDTFLDGELVWRAARKNAIIIFDDYGWGAEPATSLYHPQRGIDAFLALHQGEFERLYDDEDYQMVIRKLVDMRIGFLVNQNTQLHDALEYGVNLALAVDSAYIMPASVAIRSAVENCPGHCTVYVLDCNLSEDDRERMTSSLQHDRRAGIVFLPCRDDDLAHSRGATWGKIDLFDKLPVQRALYIDADILVRKSLRDLWDTDMGDMPVGACIDVGFPRGHDQFSGRPYYNAGVLLLNLAKLRTSLRDLQAFARERGGGFRMKDQDCLNHHFVDQIFELNLRYNAQGLRTYATGKPIPHDDMDDPTIVHFTGPEASHIFLTVVINPFVQPYTAKPWSYAGSPGHPHTEEWWDKLAETPWGDLRKSKVFQEEKEKQRQEAIEESIEAFNAVVGGQFRVSD